MLVGIQIVSSLTGPLHYELNQKENGTVGGNHSSYARTTYEGRKNSFQAETLKKSSKTNGMLGRIDWAAKYLNYGHS